MESISRVFFLSFLDDVEFEAAFPDPILGAELTHCSIMEFVVLSKWSKIGLQEFRILIEFEVRMRLPCLYRMSEDGVYQSSVLPVLSGRCRVRAARFRSNFGA